MMRYGIIYNSLAFLMVLFVSILLFLLFLLDFLINYSSPDELSCLATPPLSPPDSIGSTGLPAVASGNDGLLQVIKSGETVPVVNNTMLPLKRPHPPDVDEVMDNYFFKIV